MKRRLLAMLVVLAGTMMPAMSRAQALLDFRSDHAFPETVVETAAERTYRHRLLSLAGQGLLDENPALLGRLRRLVDGLAAAARIEKPSVIRWEIHTCRHCGENASSMSGGRLLVGEEFVLEPALSDDELGYLLAHEMAHVLAEHTLEYASAARYFVDNGRNRRYEDIQNELDESLSVSLRMSEVYAQQELEADFIGFILGARAGLEPEAMLRMLKKVTDDGGAFATMHPRRDERIRRAGAMLQMGYRIQEITAAKARSGQSGQ